MAREISPKGRLLTLLKKTLRNGTALYSLKLCHIRSEAIPNIIKNEGGKSENKSRAAVTFSVRN